MSRMTANLLLLLAGLVWGFGFVAQASAMENIGPFQFVFLRFALATLVVMPFVLSEKRKLVSTGEWVPFTPRQWRAMFTVGFIFFTMMILQQIGILGTSVTNAGMLTGLYVILVPVISLLLLRERQASMIWPASAVAIIGIWLLGGGGLDRFTWGDVVVIISAFFAAAQVIALGKTVGGTSRPVAVAAAQFAVTAVFGLAGFLIVRFFDWSLEPAFSIPTLIAAMPEVIYAAVFAGVLAFALQAIAQRHTGPAEAAILLSSEALFAALGGALLLGERLDWLGYLGCLCLFAAIAAVSVASAKRQPFQHAAKHH